LLKVIWKPQVTGISLEDASAYDMISKYAIQGDWMEDGCSVTWNQTPVRDIKYISAMELKLQLHLNAVGTPLSRLKIENPSGGVTVLEGEDLLKELGSQPASLTWKPRVDRIFPGVLHAGRDSAMVIVGGNFDDLCTVRVGGKSVGRVTVIHSSLLSFTLPSHSLQLGVYPLEVTNSNGQTTAVPNAVSVREKGLVKVVLRFEGLRQEQMDLLSRRQETGLQDPVTGSTLRVTRILEKRQPWPPRHLPGKRKRANGVVELEGILPVFLEAPTEEIRFSYGDAWLMKDASADIEVGAGATLNAQVMNVPELFQREGPGPSIG
jgi:hypothetical protein